MKISCPRCGLSHDASVEKCDCGYDLKTAVQNKTGGSIGSKAGRGRGGEFRLLRFCRIIYILSAVLVGSVSILGFILAVASGRGESISAGILTLLVNAVTVVLLIGASGVITLALSNHTLINRLMEDVRSLRKRIKE